MRCSLWAKRNIDSLAFLMDAVEAFGKPVFHGRVRATTQSNGAVHGFCGIAKPEKFRASLEAQGFEIDGFTNFADHHDFSEAEARQLLARKSRSSRQKKIWRV